MSASNNRYFRPLSSVEKLTAAELVQENFVERRRQSSLFRRSNL
jgi:hypothetical protein